MSLPTGFAYILEYEDISHIWFVASEESEDGNVLLLSFTTRHPDSDTTCVVNANEYEGLDHTSVISFVHSRVDSIQRIQLLLERNQAVPRPEVPQHIVERAQQGAMRSKFVSPNKRRLVTGAVG